jgi:hypothetical protein
MAEKPDHDLNVDEIWVNTTEAAEFTGYNYHSIRKVIQRIASQPEESREIKMRRRTTGWEMWLPDLMAYVKRPRSGPPIKRKIEKPIP